jgi:hypothetical protein
MKLKAESSRLKGKNPEREKVGSWEGEKVGMNGSWKWDPSSSDRAGLCRG